MATRSLQKDLQVGGSYSLHYLVKIEGGGYTINLVNNNTAIVFEGVEYKASTFDYTPSTTGDSSLNIETVSNDLLELLETAASITLSVIGVMYGTAIEKLCGYNHRYCKVEWDSQKAQFTVSRDDRLDMTFPALLFTSYNNRGNSNR